MFIFSTGNLLAGTPSVVSETAVVVFAGTTTATPTLVNVKFGAVPPNAGHEELPVSIASAMPPIGMVMAAGFGFVTMRFNVWLEPGENGATGLPDTAKFPLLNNEKFAGVEAPATVAVTV